MDRLSFSDALRWLTQNNNPEGRYIRRTSWNNREVVGFVKGTADFEHLSKNMTNVTSVITAIHGVPSCMFNTGWQGSQTMMPYFTYGIYQGTNMPGWMPSANDMLAADWVTVDYGMKGSEILNSGLNRSNKDCEKKADH